MGIMYSRFDSAAKEWDNKPGRMEMAQKFADVVLKSIKRRSHKTALDFGCGTGNVSFYLQDKFISINLADSSQGMLDMVREKTEKAGIDHFKPLLIDIEKKEHKGKYDVIYSLMALHHVRNVPKVISSLGKMLNKNGILIIGDLEKEDGNFHQYPENLDVHYGFEKKKLERILIENNFEVHDYGIFHELIREHTGTPVTYPLFFITAKLSYQ